MSAFEGVAWRLGVHLPRPAACICQRHTASITTTNPAPTTPPFAMASTAPPSLKRRSAEPPPGGNKKAKMAPPDQEKIQKMMAEARARAAAVAAKIATTKGVGTSQQQHQQGFSAAPQSAAQTAADRLAAMRARVTGAVSRSVSIAASLPNRPPATSSFNHRREEQEQDDGPKARGGLDVGLHPALLGDAGDMGVRKGGKGGLAPKFATTMANRRPDAIQRGKNRGKKQLDISGPSPDLTDPTKNPYFDPNLSSKAIAPRRLNKALVFNQKGKYIEQANALRRQAALETMKKRIAEAARKVGIDEDMHADKAFAVSFCNGALVLSEAHV